MSGFNIEVASTPGLEMRSGTGTSGMKMGGGKEYYTQTQADKIFARKAEVGGKQDQLSEEQLENIANVPNKADKTDVSNAVKGAVTGSTITITDISPIEHIMDVKVRSKNILPHPAAGSITINGVTFIQKSTGRIMLQGTATEDAEYILVASDNPLMLQGSTDYAVSGVGDGSGTISLRIKDMTNDVSYDMSNGVEIITFDGTDAVPCQVSVIVNSGTNVEGLTLSPQIEIGAEATIYTPYVNVADLTVTRYGADETDNAITYTPLADGIVEGVYSLHPVTTLTTSQITRVLIDCVYNKDINSVLADKSDILALQSDVDANKKKIADVEAIAKGRTTGYVFDTKDDMYAWLEDSENVAKLVLGDNLYIRATDVPDYWWDGATAQELETQKVDLSEYASTEYVDKGLADKQDQLSEEQLENIDAVPNKQDELSDEQLENIANVPNKADKTDVSNAVTETATGRAIVVTDISPLVDTLKVYSGFSGSKVRAKRQNVWDGLYEVDGLVIRSSLIYVGGGVDYYLYCNSPAYTFEESQPLFAEIIFYNCSGDEISRISNVARDSIITTPDSCATMRFILCEEFGDTNKVDICINVSDVRINGTYGPATQFYQDFTFDYDSQTDRVYATIDLLDLSHSVLTLTSVDFPEDIPQPVLECEYNKDIKCKQDKLSDEQIQNIENVLNKVDNSVKTIVQLDGSAVFTDFSPIEHPISIKGTQGVLLGACGQNIWDEVLDFTSGYGVSGYICVTAQTKYYLYCGNDDYVESPVDYGPLFKTIYYCDIDKNEITDLSDVSPVSASKNTSIITPKGCYYIKFELDPGYGTTYKNDICINVYDERINGTYAGYQERVEYVTDGNELIITPFYPVTTILAKGNHECVYYKRLDVDIEDIRETKQDKIIMEMLYEGTTTEEVSTISVTTDKEGNAFELEELYVVVKIPSPNDISPYFYLTNDIKTYTLGYGQTGTNNSTFIITWSLNNPYFKVEQYQYNIVFKTAKIIGGRIDSAAKGFKVQLYVKDDVQQVFPVGTEIEVWGRKVQ